jgi:zona occludens toxin (predicted ATPase)
LAVSKLGIKYYLPFHLFPLLFRLYKAKNPKEAIDTILKRAFYYSKSVLFMAILVAVTKGSLCFCSSTMPIRMNGSSVDS